jgi:polysaccharide biosynthesis protein PslJ
MRALPQTINTRTSWAVLGASALAVIGAAALAANAPFNALILVAVVLLIPAAVWLLSDIQRGLFALVLVIALLPRFASPVSIGFKPTAVDVAMLGLLAAWLAHLLGPARRLTLWRSAISIPVLLLAVTAVATFIVGSPNGAVTTLVLRRFVELVLSLLMILVLAAIFRVSAYRETFVRAALVLGALSALVGLVLYVIPDALATQLLSALRAFDYPTGPGVLRYIRDDPALMQRATGLWIDPNAFGGYLLMTGALCLPQVFSPRPVLPRPIVLACVGLIALCLVLTVSRAAMLGLSVAALVIGLMRYRSLLALLGVVFVAALVLPQTRELIGHFADGFAGADLATQMRFGEYRDALRLIERYPVLGVGFTGAPDVDLYVGVSSMYLLIMQQMGLVGITVFALVFVALFAGALRAWPSVRGDERAASIFLGAHAAMLGALFAGIFDHYFFNIDFHNSVLWFCTILALASASQRVQPPAEDSI